MTSRTLSIGEAVASLLRDGLPVRLEAYDGSSAGPPDADITLELVSERGLFYLLTAPGDLGMARAYVSGDLRVHGVHPGDPYDAMRLLQNHLRFRAPSPAEALGLAPEQVAEIDLAAQHLRAFAQVDLADLAAQHRLRELDLDILVQRVLKLRFKPVQRAVVIFGHGRLQVCRFGGFISRV